MEFKTLFDGTKIPSLGLGTWMMGGAMQPDYSEDEKHIQAIKDALDLGYTHIDTAEIYGGGHCEELVGKGIKGFPREKLFITTKVFKTNLKYDDVINAAKTSLKKLGTDYIDLYLIHAPNPDISIKETIEAMNYLVDQGFVKYIGVSNFTVEELKQAQKYSKHKIAANQIEYNLVTRENSNFASCTGIESEIIPYCQQNNILVMAYRPVERGVLLKPHPLLDKLAQKYGKSKAQIAINWLVSKQGILTIPKSSNKDHLKENLGSIGWNLSDDDMKLLDKYTF